MTLSCLSTGSLCPKDVLGLYGSSDSLDFAEWTCRESSVGSIFLSVGPLLLGSLE